MEKKVDCGSPRAVWWISRTSSSCRTEAWRLAPTSPHSRPPHSWQPPSTLLLRAFLLQIPHIRGARHWSTSGFSMCNQAMFVLRRPASFTQHHVPQVHLCFHRWQDLLLHTAEKRSCVWGCLPHVFFIHQPSTDTWFVPTPWLMPTMLLWTQGCGRLFEMLNSISFGSRPRSGTAGSLGSFSFLRRLHTASTAAASTYISPSKCIGFPFLHTIADTCYVFCLFDMRCEWYLTVVLTCFSPMTLSTFSFTCWPFIWLFWSMSLRILCVLGHFSCLQLFMTPWTVARQAPLSMGILQARTLEWAAIFFSRGASWPRGWAS